MVMTNETANAAYLPPPPDRIRDLLATLVDEANEDQSIRERALHDALCAYVRQLKAAHVPPERVIVTVKSIANRGGIPNSRHDGMRGPHRRDGLMRVLVEWSIAEYYRDA